MNSVFKIVAVLLVFSTIAYADGNTWNRVRYNGGTLQTKVDYKDWDNHLTVTSDLITFRLKDGQKIEIPTNSVTQLSYGQEAHRRVGTMIALGILVAPIALFGLFHKTRLHFIGIEYTTSDHKRAGLLLQGDKNNYRAILMALKSSTGAPLSVAAKDREFVPTGVASTVVKDSSEDVSSTAPTTYNASSPAANEPVTTPGSGTVGLTATPQGAEVSVDGGFVGNAPASLKLAAGKHTIAVAAPGFGTWQREVSVFAGSESHLEVTLHKSNGAAASPASAASAPPPAASATPAPQNAAEQCGALGAFSDEHPKTRSDGVEVTGFAPHSAAAKAGLQVGDFIVAVDGTYVFTLEDLTAQLCKHKPGTQVLLRYRRNAALDETTVVLNQ